MYKNRLKELGLFSPEEGRLSGDPITILRYLMGAGGKLQREQRQTLLRGAH